MREDRPREAEDTAPLTPSDSGRRRLRAALNRRVSPSVAAILLYHRVAEASLDPFRLCVPAPTFEAQLRALRTHFRLAPLRTLVDELAGGGPPEPTLVVTLDDGYADNLEAAQPVAARLEIPVTVFVAAGPVLEGMPFWWDELTALVAAARVAHGSVIVDLGGRRRVLDLRSDADAAEACRTLHGRLRRLPEASRRAALAQLAGQADGVHDSSAGRPLTEDELRRLARSPGVTIGAHTVSHPALTSLARGEQEAEVAGAKRLLEGALGEPVELFSYPYGRGGDVDVAARRLVAQAGYAAACTTVQAGVARRSDLYALPRLTVDDRPPEALLARVRRALPPARA